MKAKCTCGTGDHPSLGEDHDDDCPLYQPGATVLVFRNGVGQPVAVPEQVVKEGERPFRAYQHQLAGYSWDEVAQIEGYVDGAAAKYDVEKYLEEGKRLVTQHTRKTQLELGVAQLNALQTAVWAQAMKGHLPSIKEARGLIMDRLKATGALVTADETPEDEKPSTVIIPSTQDYEAELRKHAGS